LYREKKIDLSQAVLDGTLVPRFAFTDKTGYSGKDHRTGTKILSVTDKEGIPWLSSWSQGIGMILPLPHQPSSASGWEAEPDRDHLRRQGI